MKLSSRVVDQVAVSAAFLCALHCLFAPALIAFLPSLKSFTIVGDEAFHLWMLAGILPTSIFALSMGCKKHKKYSFFALGILGIAILTFASIWGCDLFDHEYEKYLTLSGSFFIAFAHIKNFFLCKQLKCYESRSPCEA